jgi:hypothetical protein
MDTLKDEGELVAMLDYGLVKKKAGGVACRDRPDLGPLAWTVKGKDAAIVAGPYRVHDKKVETASNCAEASKWLSDVIAQK